MMRSLVVSVVLLALTCGHGAAQLNLNHPNSGDFVSLDHVVAVINGNVLLQSDVEEEMHFAALEPLRPGAGKDTEQDAMRRLIDRTLIVQQMEQQRQFNIHISDADVEKSLRELRARLPQCARYDCKTSAGWKAFLRASDLTEPQVREHWKQRMVILRFIDLRFEAGIRISESSIESYYSKSVVEVFKKQGENPPPLKDVSARIRQVLLEQQVNGMLRDWLTSLREEGSVEIVDPAYADVAGLGNPEQNE